MEKYSISSEKASCWRKYKTEKPTAPPSPLYAGRGKISKSQAWTKRKNLEPFKRPHVERVPRNFSPIIQHSRLLSPYDSTIFLRIFPHIFSPSTRPRVQSTFFFLRFTFRFFFEFCENVLPYHFCNIIEIRSYESKEIRILEL